MIRLLAEADAAPLRALRLRALREEPDSFLSSHDVEAAEPEEVTRERLRQVAGAKASGVFGAFDGVALVGMPRMGRALAPPVHWRESVQGPFRLLRLPALALALGYLAPHVRDRWLPDLGTDLGRDQVIAFLSSVSTGMMAFTGIVFSLLIVLFQLGSSAYTPRIVSQWLKNRTLANATGVFTGTFLYSLMALRAVGIVQGSRSCALTLYIAFGWLLASLWMLSRLVRLFTTFIHANVLRMLGEQGRAAIARAHPPRPRPAGVSCAAPSEPPAQVLVHEGPPLYVVKIDVDGLVRTAREARALIRLPFAPGDSLTEGTTLALVYGAGRDIPRRSLLASIMLERERDISEDPKYALRLLVDVAVRALSAAVNDPTTTVQALDQIEALLTMLAERDLGTGRVTDDGGNLRLIYDATTWEEYLELALAEIQFYGASSLQTERRLTALLAFLRDHVPAQRRAAVDALAQQHVAAVMAAFHGQPRVVAERGDRQGLGHTLP
jgi:uncharacterized membrane protein